MVTLTPAHPVRISALRSRRTKGKAAKKIATKKATPKSQKITLPKSRMTQAEKLQHLRDIGEATLRAGKEGYRQGKEDALREASRGSVFDEAPPSLRPTVRAAEASGQGSNAKDGLIDRALVLVQNATQRIHEVASTTKRHTDGVMGADAPDSAPSPRQPDSTRGPRGVELMNALDVLHVACEVAEQESYRLPSI